MKLYNKILALILVCATLLTVLVSCDSGKIEETETEAKASESLGTEIETEKEETPSVTKKNYDSQFYLSIHPDSNPVKYYWIEESDNDAMSQAIFDRQQKVNSYLGVDIQATTTLTSINYVEPFKVAVKNKDGSVDAMLTHVYHGVDGFITENYLTDFNNISQINLDADYWKRDVMEEISINDHMYLGYSNFNIMYTHVIAFNKSIMEQYSDSLDESVYDMVTNYRWTLDKMIGLANMVYIDAGSDGKTKDDTFGIIGLHDIAFCGFLHSSDISLVEPSANGAYELAVYNDLNKAKTTSIVEKIGELVKSDCAWFWRSGSGNHLRFQDGKAFLVLARTYDLPDYLNYDINFGVLPYPMYDEEQKSVGYRSLQWGGYLCVPSYVNDFDMVGDTLEVLSFYSNEVNNTFYEKLLGKQVAESPIDKKMLEIVWDGICSDFCQTYYSSLIDTKILYIVPQLTFEGSNGNISSFIAGAEKSVNKRLKVLFSKAK